MIEKFKKFQRMIIFSLMIMMMLVLFLSTLDLAWIIIQDIITPPYLLPDVKELLEIFGFVLLILIGIELTETMVKTYESQSVDHAQIVMAVAIIAISRKVIVLEVNDLNGLSLLGIAAIILSLSIGYFLLKWKANPRGKNTRDGS